MSEGFGPCEQRTRTCCQNWKKWSPYYWYCDVLWCIAVWLAIVFDLFTCINSGSSLNYPSTDNNKYNYLALIYLWPIAFILFQCRNLQMTVVIQNKKPIFFYLANLSLGYIIVIYYLVFKVNLYFMRRTTLKSFSKKYNV